MSEQHARQDAVELREQVRAGQGKRGAAGPGMVGILQDQGAVPGHGGAQLAGQFGEQRRPAEHRARPRLHRPERAPACVTP